MFKFFQGSTAANGFRRIDIGEFEAMRGQQNPPLLLDVREPFELTAFGSIPGIVNIPLGQLKAQASRLPADKDAPIVVICQSGNRSLQGARHLVDLGYRNLYSLDGGTLTWLRTVRK